MAALCAGWLANTSNVLLVQEVEVLRQQVSNYDKNKLTLQLTKQRLVQADKQFKNLEWEKEVLAQRFAKVEAERDELYSRFEASIFELQQKTGLKGALLARKLEAAYEVLEKKESQLAEILAASNLDAPTLQNVRPPGLLPVLLVLVNRVCIRLPCARCTVGEGACRGRQSCRLRIVCVSSHAKH